MKIPYFCASDRMKSTLASVSYRAGTGFESASALCCVLQLGSQKKKKEKEEEGEKEKKKKQKKKQTNKQRQKERKKERIEYLFLGWEEKYVAQACFLCKRGCK